MCGIAGILFPKESGESVFGRLGRMKRALAHRGPDAEGLLVSGEAALAHTRLALVDLEGGRQPMSDPSGRFTIVFNGEIYNHMSLRGQLGSRCEWRTDSDTETLLSAWRVWGEQCLERLEGMFAFVVWDKVRRCAFAARDALGVKPLVYARRGQEVLFASEAKALLAGGWPARINEAALVEVLVAPSLSGVRQSMFEGVRHLPAGHLMTVERHRVQTRAWTSWSVPSEPRYSDEAVSESLRGALVRAVARSMRADVPVGVFLSGGLDSTALAALASRHTRDEALMAFTIRFEDHERIDYSRSSIVISDDAPYVEEASEALGLALVRVEAGQAQMVRDLARLAATNDRVPVWEQELAQDALARAASGRRKAVLVGDAADETHFGYFFLLDDAVNKSPRALMARFGAEARAAHLSERLRLEDPIDTLDADYRRLVEQSGVTFDGPPSERIRAMTCLVVKLWLGRLLHNGDIHTMAHGVEARVPFSDPEVVAVAMRVAPSQGWRGGVEKVALREAVRPFVPDSIYRRKKSALPRDPRLGRLYQQALPPLLDAEADFAHDVLDTARVRRLCEADALDDNARGLLFNLLSLMHWKRHYLG